MQGVDRAIKRFSDHGIEVTPYYAVSDNENYDLIAGKEYFIECSNALIGQKHNLLLQFALQDKWDFMLQLGSDDLMLDEAIDQIAVYIHKGVEFGAFQHLYVANPETRQMKYFRGQQCFGAGRFFSRRVVDLVLQKKGVFWTPEKQRGLDGDSSRRVTQVTKLWPKVLDGPFGVDIKGKENLNKWHKFQGLDMGWKELTPEIKLL
jgi:hypothetical protein